MLSLPFMMWAIWFTESQLALSFQEDIHYNVHLYNDQDGELLNALLYHGLDPELKKSDICEKLVKSK